MLTYNETDLLRLAKRFHNIKRTYLLMNPLQAKHMSVQPAKAIEMFRVLGRKIKDSYDEIGLVIGFAETATAVGMAVAEEISGDCIYIHTTREVVPEENTWIEFSEEHSHAVDQKLSGSYIEKWIKSSKSIVFVDDEISTGKTLINIITQLKGIYPEIEHKKLIAASIINRVSDKNLEIMRENGIECVSLLKLDEIDYAEQVKDFSISEANEPDELNVNLHYTEIRPKVKLINPRLGVSVQEYRRNLDEFADTVINDNLFKHHGSNILVMGTEECMYPAIVLGDRLQNTFKTNVYSHSTTRSPIGICTNKEYPVQGGFKLKSLYDDERTTYIYNLKKYDRVIIVTDSNKITDRALGTLKNSLAMSGNNEILLIRG